MFHNFFTLYSTSFYLLIFIIFAHHCPNDTHNLKFFRIIIVLGQKEVLFPFLLLLLASTVTLSLETCFCVSSSRSWGCHLQGSHSVVPLKVNPALAFCQGAVSFFISTLQAVSGEMSTAFLQLLASVGMPSSPVMNCWSGAAASFVLLTQWELFWMLLNIVAFAGILEALSKAFFFP